MTHPIPLVARCKTKVPPEDHYSSHDMRYTFDSNKGSYKGGLKSWFKSPTWLILENPDVLAPGYMVPGKHNLNCPTIVVGAVTHSTTMANNGCEPFLSGSWQ